MLPEIGGFTGNEKAACNGVDKWNRGKRGWLLDASGIVVVVSGESVGLGYYLHKLSAFVGNPIIIFVVSDAIITALVAQSGRLTTSDDDNMKSGVPLFIVDGGD